MSAYLIQARRWSKEQNTKWQFFYKITFQGRDMTNKQNKVIHFITKKIIIYNMNSYIIWKESSEAEQKQQLKKASYVDIKAC